MSLKHILNLNLREKKVRLTRSLKPRRPRRQRKVARKKLKLLRSQLARKDHLPLIQLMRLILWIMTVW